MLFLVFVAPEIGVFGALETPVAVAGGMDFVIRKNKPIRAWIVG
jgi:hypothetical protein